MIQKYSLAIEPSELILSRVKEMKQQLRIAVGGHYGSANSAAHISLFEFKIADDRYSLISTHYKRIVAGLAPFDIAFDGFDHFQHGMYFTFYVKLTERTSGTILNYCKQIKNISPYSHVNKFIVPHMTIGRRLTKRGLDLAYGLFTEFVFNYCCEAFVVRKFNSKRGQYDIEELVPLLNSGLTSNAQLSLF